MRPSVQRAESEAVDGSPSGNQNQVNRLGCTLQYRLYFSLAEQLPIGTLGTGHVQTSTLEPIS